MKLLGYERMNGRNEWQRHFLSCSSQLKIQGKLKYSESWYCFANISATEAQIFMKFYVEINFYHVNLSLKFHKDPILHCWDICKKLSDAFFFAATVVLVSYWYHYYRYQADTETNTITTILILHRFYNINTNTIHTYANTGICTGMG